MNSLPCNYKSNYVYQIRYYLNDKIWVDFEALNEKCYN